MAVAKRDVGGQGGRPGDLYTHAVPSKKMFSLFGGRAGEDVQSMFGVPLSRHGVP